MEGIATDGKRNGVPKAPSMYLQVELLRRVVFDLIDETRMLGETHDVEIADALQRVANELGLVQAHLRYANRDS